MLHFSPITWAIFIIVVIAIAFVDLTATVNKEKQANYFKLASIILSVSLLTVMTIVVLLYNQDKRYAIDFVVSYFVELSLSTDNVFVFIMVFKYFQVAPSMQHKILFWGIFGAIVMRFFMIIAGTQLIQKFSWMMYIFGIILVYSAFKMLTTDNKHEINLDKNLMIRILRKITTVYLRSDANSFFIRDKRTGKLAITKFFVALLLIEKADLLFAIDSIPAVIAITSEPFIIFSSNILAILCLRSIYTFVSYIIERLEYIKYGVAAILVFLGIKMILSVHDVHTPNNISLFFIVICLSVPVIYGYIKKKSLYSKKNNTTRL